MLFDFALPLLFWWWVLWYLTTSIRMFSSILNDKLCYVDLYFFGMLTSILFWYGIGCLSIQDADDCPSMSHIWRSEQFWTLYHNFRLLNIFYHYCFGDSYVTSAVMKFLSIYFVHQGMNLTLRAILQSERSRCDPVWTTKFSTGVWS